MEMFNPPHPGEFIEEVYLRPFNISIRALATKLGVASSTLSRLVKQQSGISPEMALRLSKALGSSAESWLTMQTQYDLWHARQKLDLSAVEKVDFETAA
ncbi:HigA family addiction module antitoxin [Synechococcus sp. PCC 7336]|uniref:HigA family addiction module antitoxin n=1 Tax=Synechococcus sp. PCC 7336 TaxID=195250 RepID=UPI00034D4A8F|nr:HigA family addiction module antitoxin [Synechococcus sp. PCC 7336]